MAMPVTSPSAPTARTQRGYIPALDGLRAVAVLAVLAYHAGANWLPGGFLGVDIFFALSGYLITYGLALEWERDRQLKLGRFYRRRARRLLPALFLVLAAVAVYCVIGLPDESYRLRGDLVAALAYCTNWAHVYWHQSYFAALGRPRLLQHLWSLAIEEQFYLVWPLVLTALGLFTKRRWTPAVCTAVLASGSAIWMAVQFDPYHDPSRLYYGTDTHASALLIGAMLALLLPPKDRRLRGDRAVLVDGSGLLSLAVITGLMVTQGQYSSFLYHGGFTIVAGLTAVVIAAALYGCPALTTLLSGRVMRWVGSRSYGIYLWHWPIFLVSRPRSDLPWPTWQIDGVRIVATFLLAELSFRFVEAPIRRGALVRLREHVRTEGWPWRLEGRRWLEATGAALLAVLVLAMVVVRLGAAERPASGLAAAQAEPVSHVHVTPLTAPPATLPEPNGARVQHFNPPVGTVVVGDSQAEALVANAPPGLEQSLRLEDGSVEGCGIAGGKLTSSVGYRRDLDEECGGWADKWAASAHKEGTDIALVVVGAWEVFDLAVGGHDLRFGSPDWDRYLTQQMSLGVNALRRAGVSVVALLGVPCYRPIDGGGLTALPERGDDARTAHLNQLFHAMAKRDPVHTVFVRPPREFCSDESIATDVNYRWDGVHYYKPGSSLVFQAIVPQLLTIPRPQAGR